MLLHETKADSWMANASSYLEWPNHHPILSGQKQDMMLSSILIILKPGQHRNQYTRKLRKTWTSKFMSKRSMSITKRWPITMFFVFVVRAVCMCRWNQILLATSQCSARWAMLFYFMVHELYFLCLKKSGESTSIILHVIRKRGNVNY